MTRAHKVCPYECSSVDAPNTVIDDVGEEIVNGEVDIAVVAGGADNKNMDDDNPTVVIQSKKSNIC